MTAATRYRKPMPACWPTAWTVFDLPEGHRVRMRTTTGLERLNKAHKRRIRVATVAPQHQHLSAPGERFAG